MTPTHRVDRYVHAISPWDPDPLGEGRWRGWLRPAAGGEWEENHGFVGTREALVRRSAAEILRHGGEALHPEVAAAVAELEAEEAERERAEAARREAEAAESAAREARRREWDDAARRARVSMREIRVAGAHRVRQVRALVLGDGPGALAVHPAVVGAGFAVTHAASGRRVLTQPTQGMARVAAARLAPLADWSVSARELKRNRALAAAVAAIAQDVYAELPTGGGKRG